MMCQFPPTTIVRGEERNFKNSAKTSVRNKDKDVWLRPTTKPAQQWERKAAIMTRAGEWDGEATNDGVWEEAVAVAGESPDVRAQPSLSLAGPRSEKTLKQKDHLLEKEREGGRAKGEGGTVRRHFRTVWVKHWPHLNIHGQCVAPLSPH